VTPAVRQRLRGCAVLKIPIAIGELVNACKSKLSPRLLELPELTFYGVLFSVGAVGTPRVVHNFTSIHGGQITGSIVQYKQGSSTARRESAAAARAIASRHRHHRDAL
jgi:hypothetical protein